MGTLSLASERPPQAGPLSPHTLATFFKEAKSTRLIMGAQLNRRRASSTAILRLQAAHLLLTALCKVTLVKIRLIPLHVLSSAAPSAPLPPTNMDTTNTDDLSNVRVRGKLIPGGRV